MSLECATCLEAFESTGKREPRSLPLCGHSLCLSCLRVVLTRGQQCPTCRTPFGAENSTEARFPKNFVAHSRDMSPRSIPSRPEPAAGLVLLALPQHLLRPREGRPA